MSSGFKTKRHLELSMAMKGPIFDMIATWYQTDACAVFFQADFRGSMGAFFFFKIEGDWQEAMLRDVCQD
jgi:hypothetical protein